MNNDLVWRFDVSVFEWLIVLAMLVILAIVSAVITRQSLKAFREQNYTPDNRATASSRWHTETAEIIFETFVTQSNGLTKEEAGNRLGKYGPNQLPDTKIRGPLVRFFYQFHNILIYVLIAASAITAMLGHWVDASVILGVVLINAVIGFVQEGKAENALKAIRQMLSPNAMVLRNDKQISIPAKELVPGDVVLLQSGDKVPADLRLFRVKGLQIQESVLTGESIAVEKTTEPVALEAMIGDRRCMAYSGTLVTHGQGAGVVIATGSQTEIGHISTLVADVESITTPLLRQMAEFGRWLRWPF